MTHIPLRVEPEYRDKIQPLTPEEFNQLRDNILADGRVYEPIDTWNGVIIDGHHRWKIVQEHPEIPYEIREHDFADKWEAFDWMYRKQLGRRNLTEQQRYYMIGKMYEARKNGHGNNAERGSDGKYLSAQNGHTGNRIVRQDEEIAKELGIGHNTVRRAEKFAKGVDALKSVAPEAAAKMLSGEVTVSKSAVKHLADIPQSALKRAAQSIVDNKPEEAADIMLQRTQDPSPAAEPKESAPPVEDTPREPSAEVKSVLKARSNENAGYTANRRELDRMIDEAYKPMLDESAQSAFDINDLVEDITTNGNSYVALLRRTIDQRRDLMQTEHDRDLVRAAVVDVMDAVMKVRVSI